MKIAAAVFAFLSIAGCAGMQTITSCQDSKLTCPVGTQKECYQEQGHACECRCHPLDQSPFTPVDETGDH